MSRELRDGTGLTLRRHQGEALAALEALVAKGADRAWVALPPGAGKTILGVEHALRLGRRTVVFCPNTAIVGQWVTTWDRMRPHGVGVAGDDRSLEHDCTVLTYQSLAVFDPESDEAPGLARLHPNGLELVRRLHAAAPLTIILDECHHLLQVWGQLLRELMEELQGEVVLGLTATPPEQLSAQEAELVDDLFGEITYSVGIPAVVAAGDLVPFQELAWLTQPTPTETQWLNSRAERVNEFTTALMDPKLADPGLLTWLDLRFVRHDSASGAPARSWDELQRQHPELADAVVRLALSGHCGIPDGAVVRERHHHEPTIEDWMLVVEDWLDNSVTEHAPEVASQIHDALPSIGFRRVRGRILAGQSPVDTVLSRSVSKAYACVEIVAHQLATSDPRLLILCEYSQAASLPPGLSGVIADQAGSAELMLDVLLSDARTAAADPVLVTGSVIAGERGTLDALLATVPARAREGLTISPHPRIDCHIVTGWGSKQWVPAATQFFEAGGTRCLIGTRALLGEGWDACGITGVIDVTTATTTTAIVQTRGRALRTDPRRPDKVATNWTVTCIAPGMPQGDSDWQRLVRKHQGWFSVDEAGDVVDGVAHLDSRFSPFQPPEPSQLDGLRATALVRCEDTSAVAAAWERAARHGIHVPHATLRIRPRRAAPTTQTYAGLPATRPEPEPVPVPWALLAAVLAGTVILPWLMPYWVTLVWAVGGLSTVLASRGVRRRAQHVRSLVSEPSLADYARTVADAMNQLGHSDVGAEAVEVGVTPDGEYRARIAGVGQATSALFAEALEELLSEVTRTRYLISRPVLEVAGGWLVGLTGGRATVAGHAWHQVPSLFGSSRADADQFADAWHRWVGPGRAVFVGTPEGAGVFAAFRGSHPIGEADIVTRNQL